MSGYTFRSKKDAMRFLKTKDIRYCACRPLKRDLNDIKLIENEIPVSMFCLSVRLHFIFYMLQLNCVPCAFYYLNRVSIDLWQIFTVDVLFLEAM